MSVTDRSVPVADTETASAPSTELERSTATVSRRGFLRGVGGAGVLGAASLAGGTALVKPAPAAAETIGPLTPRQRQALAFRTRNLAARNQLNPGQPDQECNGDEDAYPDRRASFFKTLPQDNLGEVDPAAYDQFLTALESGEQADFDAIPLSNQADRKLANPMASYAFEMTGGDGHSSRMPPAPAFDSAFISAEMAEVYWQALTRDVPFADYDSDPLVAAAVADLNGFSTLIGPTVGGVITPGTLFRGETAGDLIGPYLSQFLWLDIPFGQRNLD
ncbi:MAG: hypothetical protein AAF657_13380, partial [Acidobacteriota bacterium]